MMTDTCILLSGFGGLDNPGPGGSTASALHRTSASNLRILALSGQDIEPGIVAHEAVDAVVSLPGQHTGGLSFASGLTEACRATEFDIFIPGSNRHALAAAQSRSRLQASGIALALPDIGWVELACRDELAQLADAAGLKAHPSLKPASPQQSRAIAVELGCPVWLKSDAELPQLAFTPAEAEAAYTDANPQDQASLRLQRALGGESWRVAGVRNGDTGKSAITALKPLATDPRGRIAAGTVVDDRDIISAGRTFAEALGWHGPFEIEIRRTPFAKDLYLCDVRCHLPAWTATAAACGINLAHKLLDAAGVSVRRKRLAGNAGALFVAGVSENVTTLGGQPVPVHHPASGSGKDHRGGLSVMVTGIGSFDVINPGLGVARSLGASDQIANVYGLGYGNFDSGLFQPELFSRCFRLDFDVREAGLLDRLTKIHRRHNFDVMIPCLDGELEKFIAISDGLRELGVDVLLPGKRALEVRSKLGLTRQNLDWGGFSIPESLVAASEKQCIAAAGSLGFPVAVKGPDSFCMIAATPADIKDAWRAYKYRGDKKVIVQQHLSGEIFAVSAVCDHKHRLVSAFTAKKFASCSRGSTWGAINVSQPELEAAFGRFLAAIRWRGPAEGEFVRDRLNDRFYLFEVNPRFTGWISFTAGAGYNQPLQAAKLASGGSHSLESPSEQYVFARRATEVFALPRHFASLTTRKELAHA